MEHAFTILKGILAAVGGFVVHWLGGIDELLAALVGLIVLDYVTGMLAAWHTHSLSSGVGFRGISKKIMLLSVVALAFIIERLTGAALPLREITIMFFAVNEGLSVLENAARIGLPLPQKLLEVLQQLEK